MTIFSKRLIAIGLYAVGGFFFLPWLTSFLGCLLFMVVCLPLVAVGWGNAADVLWGYAAIIFDLFGKIFFPLGLIFLGFKGKLLWTEKDGVRDKNRYRIMAYNLGSGTFLAIGFFILIIYATSHYPVFCSRCSATMAGVSCYSWLSESSPMNYCSKHGHVWKLGFTRQMLLHDWEGTKDSYSEDEYSQMISRRDAYEIKKGGTKFLLDAARQAIANMPEPRIKLPENSLALTEYEGPTVSIKFMNTSSVSNTSYYARVVLDQSDGNLIQIYGPGR